MPIPGRCLCGEIRFEIEPPTEFCSHCHCQSCRLSHGAGFVTWTSVPEERFRLLHGAPRAYASSARVSWLFCGNCGSSMFYRSTEAPGRIYLTAANLIGPLDREPDSHVSFEEHVGWIERAGELPRFQGKTSIPCPGRGTAPGLPPAPAPPGAADLL
ncbi:MAG: GFA family protein [Candidatus Eremiobacterota bacterium]